MKKRPSSIFAALFILAVLSSLYFTMMPKWTSNDNVPLSEFSTKRGLRHSRSYFERTPFCGFRKSRTCWQLSNKRTEKIRIRNLCTRRVYANRLGESGKIKKYSGSDKGYSKYKSIIIAYTLRQRSSFFFSWRK